MPDFELTPQRIFQNEILAFDVNFFNPKADKVKTETKLTQNLSTNDYDIGFEVWAYDKDGTEKGYNSNGKTTAEGGSSSFTFSNCTPQSIAETMLSSIGKEGQNPDKITPEVSYVNGEPKQEFCIGNTYQKHDSGNYTGHYGTLQTYTFKYGDCKVKVKYYTWYYNGWISKTQKEDGSVEADTQTVSTEISPARLLQPVISSWYTTLRNIALVALLSVLVYIGIRITLSSVASDKAKYKQMLGDWVVALCLIFLMHYIMAFAVSINEKIIDAISSITVSSSASKKANSINNSTALTNEKGEEISEYTTAGTTDSAKVKEQLKNAGDENETEDAGVELFLITDKDDVKLAWKTLVGDKGENSKFYSYFDGTDENSVTTLAWPANDFMTQARIYGQMIEVDKDGKETNANQTAVVRAGYNIIYVVLVIYTIIFCFTYLKRVIYMAFLTIIAPLVAITYPIDKMNDGKAQAFEMWLKEYIFNLLIQPLHLILYTILIGSAMEFATINIFYVVIALGFLIPAEKLLRRFFGFEKAQTPGMFAGAAGSALMMSGLNKLMHPKPPKGGLGPGGNNSKDGEEEAKTPPWRDKEFDATDNLIGIGETGTRTQNNDSNTNDPTGEQENENPILNAYDENYGTDAWDAQERDALARNMNNAPGMSYSDDEYRQILRESGYSDQEIAEFMSENNNPNGRNNNPNNFGNTISDRIRASSSETQQPKRKISKRKAIKHGMQSYGDLLKKRYKANKAQKGGFIKRGIRMAGGVAAAGTLAAAGGVIGITSGDPSKAAQYMAAGAAGGYSLGTKAIDGADNSRKRAKESIDAFKEGYYGDEYSKKQQEKYKKDFIRNDENVSKIAKKLKVERKEAREIIENDMGYYMDKEIYNIDDLIATYRLEKEGNMSREQAVATAQYATQVMNGEDTRYMTSKKKNEYRNTFIPKFTQKGSRNPEADVDKVFDNVDKFHKFKK